MRRLGRLLSGGDPKQPADESVAVMDFVNGEWVRTVAGKNTCGAGKAPVLQSWTLKPRNDGALTGLRRLAFFSVDCTGAYEQPMSAARIGDVDAALTMPDPAKEPPLKPSAPQGFHGRYNVSVTDKDGRKAPDVQMDVTTTCVRNVNHCLTYSISRPSGPAAALPLLISSKVRPGPPK